MVTGVDAENSHILHGCRGPGKPSRRGACEKRREWFLIEDVLARLGSCCSLIILEHLDGHPAFGGLQPTGFGPQIDAEADA